MKLSMKYVILYVSDFDKAMEFYKDVLGLSVKMQQGTYVEFDTGYTTLAINTRQSVRELTGLNVLESDTTSKTFEVGFVVDHVEDTIEALRQKGVTIIKEPVTKPWGQTVAYVSDPDGHYIEICSSLE